MMLKIATALLITAALGFFVFFIVSILHLWGVAFVGMPPPAWVRSLVLGSIGIDIIAIGLMVASLWKMRKEIGRNT